ncbi:MAG: serine/threonine protein kinase [Deltaproteobacteria bacterium]|nr:serine/threonine protein kinase [Deltaproteobacteria bacterium]
MSGKAQQRYRVMERLAAGGMAEVFLAESAGLEGFKKKVAIKRVLPHLSEKKRFIAMFLDEARLSAQFNHSNVAHVFDIGVGDDAYFIVMEYVDGCDLKTVMSSFANSGRPFPLEAALYIASKLCEGLAYAHELKGLDGKPLYAVHRDMSPPNVLLSRHGEVKIVDFGLAKASSQLEKSEPGIIKGKFSYLSPEAALGNEVDARADIFAVGVILWELLAGQRLFQGRTDFDTVKLVQSAVVKAIATKNPEAADPEIQRILSRSLARERADRYGTARELGRDLTRMLFRIGKPVDAFTVGELVTSVTTKRDSAPPAEGMQAIDQLIDESLLRFTSLRQQSQMSPASALEPPRSLDLEKLGSWGAASARGDATELVRANVPEKALEHGNLAALEDTPREGSLRAAKVSAGKRPGVDPGLLASIKGARGDERAGPDSGLAAKAPDSGPEEPLPLVVPASKKPRAPSAATPRAEGMVDAATNEHPSGGSAAVKTVLLLLIAAGAGAAVYFSGLL